MRTEGVSLDVARQIMRVQGHADNVRDAAQAAIGARFGTLRIASSGHIVVKVVHPEPADQTALDRIAQDCGIPGWVRLESFPQEWVQAWDSVREALEQLKQDFPQSLVVWPGGRERREPPFRIQLAAHAQPAAEALWRNFGPLVALKVGFLAYPPQPGQIQAISGGSGRHTHPPAPMDPTELTVKLPRDVQVPSGFKARTELTLTNHSSQPVSVRTNGHLTATVVEPGTGRPIGGAAGPQRSPLRLFTAQRGATVTIPLLVATASYHIQLGYAVPPGRWALTVDLTTKEFRTVVTPELPFTITQAQIPHESQ